MAEKADGSRKVQCPYCGGAGETQGHDGEHDECPECNATGVMTEAQVHAANAFFGAYCAHGHDDAEWKRLLAQPIDAWIKELPDAKASH
ncbi:hypothetical protein [Azospirillum sp. sgz302134]